MAPELAEVREWLRKASLDRRMAEAGLAQTPPITAAAAFHSQQAAEKSIKAFLVFHEQPFEHIHDLAVLLGQCAKLDADWAPLRDSVEPLTTYAVRFRYPGPPDPSVDEVQAALDVVREVWDFVVVRLPEEARP
ncbi:MAG: HEPN domain-containing protein [Planctomycetes bacterium]|nr:HEPN domain-containing protein [Planctomycetota bacterium]